MEFINRWKRIIPNINKRDIILTVSLNSLKKSILKFSKDNKLKITVNLISDSSDKKFNEK